MCETRLFVLATFWQTAKISLTTLLFVVSLPRTNVHASEQKERPNLRGSVCTYYSTKLFNSENTIVYNIRSFFSFALGLD
jgi:hypothetical protein